MQYLIQNRRGMTLIELLAAISMGAILVLGLSELVGHAMQSYDRSREINALTRQARFAMQRMVKAVSHTRYLQLPLNDKPWSNWAENIREETVPPTPPTDDSTQYTAVLAVALPLYVDLNQDGVPDADDDGDGLVDEDLPNDMNLDYTPGIIFIDDDGDGTVDEAVNGYSDDESSSINDDPINGIDDDNDNNVDEDPASDNNGDGCSGLCGVDDDGDGLIDEDGADNDDEEGGEWEDWINALVFYLDSGTLKERMPVPWDTNSSGHVTGEDFITSNLAENVTRFRVERMPLGTDRLQRVDLILELTGPVTGEIVSLETQVRVGGAL